MRKKDGRAVLNVGTGRPLEGRRLPWRRGGPARTRERGCWEWACGRPPHWAQHMFRFVADDGQEFFVGQPRDLNDDDIYGLAALAADGWRVWLSSTVDGPRGPVLQVVVESAEQAAARSRAARCPEAAA